MMITNKEPWASEAACATTDPELFFPDAGGHGIKDARMICRDCPVTSDCLEFALTTRQHYGIWGGMTEAERTRLLRRRRKLQLVKS